MTGVPEAAPRGDDCPAAGQDAPVAAGGVRYCVRWFGAPATPPTGAQGEGDAEDRWPAAPAVLLLHDVAGGLGDWDVLAGELAADRVGLAVSPKGLGASEDRAPYRASALASELAALVLHAVDGPVDVVGHGTGATLAWNLAAQRPDLVRRIVLISGGRALAPWAVARLVGAAATARGRELAREGARGWTGRRVGAWFGGGEVMRRGRVRVAYAQLDVAGRISPQRALVVWGTRDTLASLAMGQRILDTLSRGVRPATVRMVTLPGAGHVPLADSPGRCASLVADFLRSP